MAATSGASAATATSALFVPALGVGAPPALPLLGDTTKAAAAVTSTSLVLPPGLPALLWPQPAAVSDRLWLVGEVATGLPLLVESPELVSKPPPVPGRLPGLLAVPLPGRRTTNDVAGAAARIATRSSSAAAAAVSASLRTSGCWMAMSSSAAKKLEYGRWLRSWVRVQGVDDRGGQRRELLARLSALCRVHAASKVVPFAHLHG